MFRTVCTDPAQDAGGSKQKRVFCFVKTRSQKCTRMYIFDEVVAVGFHSPYYATKRWGMNPSARIINSMFLLPVRLNRLLLRYFQ